MKTILLAVAIMALCMLLLAVRIIFGRHKEFLQGHACRGVRHDHTPTKQNTTNTDK